MTEFAPSSEPDHITILFIKYLIPATEELFGRPVTDDGKVEDSEVLAMLGTYIILLLDPYTRKEQKAWLRALARKLEESGGS